MTGFRRFLPLSIRQMLMLVCLSSALPTQAAPANEALLSIEHAQARYEGMQESAQFAAGLLGVLYKDRKNVAQTIALADTQASAAFDVPAAMAAMRDALDATAPVPQSQAQALERIAQTMASRDAQMRALPAEALEAEGEAMAQRLAARPDSERIEALLPMMAEPALAAENAIGAERMYQLMEILVVEGQEAAVKEIRLLGEDAMRQELIHVVRAAPAEARALGQEREIQYQMAIMRKRYVLSYLPPEDVQTLHDFYVSEVGRAKRDAMVQAFAARNDEDSMRALLGMLE